MTITFILCLKLIYNLERRGEEEGEWKERMEGQEGGITREKNSDCRSEIADWHFGDGSKREDKNVREVGMRGLADR